MKNVKKALVLLLLVSGCAGPGTSWSANQTTANAAESPETVVLRMVPTAEASARDREMAMELRGDGALLMGGRRVATLRSDRALDPQGQVLFQVSADGAVTITGSQASSIRLTDDSIVGGPGGRSITVSADGTPLGVEPGQPPQPGPFRLEGYNPSRRRMALMMMLFALAGRAH